LAASIRTAVFAPASGPGVGGGHVMRGLTLAQALARRGVACRFAVGPVGAALIERFAGGAFPVTRLGRLADLPAALGPDGCDLLVLDDYGADARTEGKVRGAARRIAVIDDLADRAHAADILIDPGFERRPDDYDGLLPPAALRLIGPAYALVREGFAARRAAALARPVGETPGRVFASFGLGDVQAIAARAVRWIRATAPEARIDLALAADAESRPALEAMADPALYLHLDAADPAALMAEADFAVGAGGASTWERACLGLPTLAVILADNQRAMIRRMAAAGVLLAVDLAAPEIEADVQAALAQLRAPETRRALRDRSAALCDGQGAGRVAEAIIG
jgi:UDP-2,4-diacetamido-2,4,6-trideoxy-beta-L-altropyranose hydrolase